MHLDGDQWTTFFGSFEREAFRLETLPVYSVEGEEDEFETFRATGKLELPEDDPWLVKVRSFRDSGRRIRRVHVVTRPLSDYLRYEFAAYRYNVEAGEDVRILDLTDRENPGLPDQDFWLFGSSEVVTMNYRSDGTQVSRDLLEVPDLNQYRQWKELALSLSVPLSEYGAD
ncbi:DUF6879 family protein [Streptomyces sp. NPDC102274]|uniref:DUF6879 family protein n=1 Tax=Streptomyces sp. NPDC102274 TaxID=3366151 RepID=UPI0037F558F0